MASHLVGERTPTNYSGKHSAMSTSKYKDMFIVPAVAAKVKDSPTKSMKHKDIGQKIGRKKNKKNSRHTL